MRESFSPFRINLDMPFQCAAAFVVEAANCAAYQALPDLIRSSADGSWIDDSPECLHPSIEYCSLMLLDLRHDPDYATHSNVGTGHALACSIDYFVVLNDHVTFTQFCRGCAIAADVPPPNDWVEISP